MVRYLISSMNTIWFGKKNLISESHVTYEYMDDFTFILNVYFWKSRKEKILIIE